MISDRAGRPMLRREEPPRRKNLWRVTIGGLFVGEGNVGSDGVDEHHFPRL